MPLSQIEAVVAGRPAVQVRMVTAGGESIVRGS
jgi:hypothetical protein